jgi:hypothetical protein
MNRSAETLKNPASAFPVDDIGYVTSGFENRKKVGLLQTPLFHQI